jgi:transcription antitermination factor NusG
VALSSVEWIPGLRRVVAFDDQPTPLPDAVIEFIQQRLRDIKTAGGYPEPAFKPGETVRIIDGPFKEMVAIFDRSTPASRRVQVLLNVLGQASRVKVDLTHLAKVSPDQAAPSARPPRRTRGHGRPIIVH